MERWIALIGIIERYIKAELLWFLFFLTIKKQKILIPKVNLVRNFFEYGTRMVYDSKIVVCINI